MYWQNHDLFNNMAVSAKNKFLLSFFSKMLSIRKVKNQLIRGNFSIVHKYLSKQINQWDWKGRKRCAKENKVLQEKDRKSSKIFDDKKCTKSKNLSQVNTTFESLESNNNVNSLLIVGSTFLCSHWTATTHCTLLRGKSFIFTFTLGSFDNFLIDWHFLHPTKTQV